MDARPRSRASGSSCSTGRTRSAATRAGRCCSPSTHLRGSARRDRPAARHDRGRAGPAVQRRVPPATRPASSCRSSVVEDARLEARHVRTTTPGCRGCMPLPNMPTPDTALVYPGTCLFEATNLSEGRGTTRPFELIGAPYVDYTLGRGAARRRRCRASRSARPTSRRRSPSTPTTVCGGVQLQVTDPRPFDADPHRRRDDRRARQAALRRTSPGAPRPDRTGSTSSPAPTRFRTMLDGGRHADEVVGGLAATRSPRSTHRRAQYLLYRGTARR